MKRDVLHHDAKNAILSTELIRTWKLGEGGQPVVKMFEPQHFFFQIRDGL